MRRAFPLFGGSAVSVGLLIAALALTTDEGLSEGVRSAATLGRVGFSVMAVVLALWGFVVWWQMSNGRLSVRPHDSTTAVLIPPEHDSPWELPMVRLQLENGGTPGDFHGRAWWVDDGERSDEWWDICWRNTAETAVHVDDQREINLLIVEWSLHQARPVRRSFPQIEVHTSVRGDDHVVEVEIWRTGNKKPIRTWWELRHFLDEWSLESVDQP